MHNQILRLQTVLPIVLKLSGYIGPAGAVTKVNFDFAVKGIVSNVR